MAAPPMIPSLRLSNQIANEEPRTTTTSRPARRVRWASENNLCQVRLFVAEEPPFHAGQTELQDQLQAKKHIAFNSETPPGFDINPLAQRSQEILNSPQTTWKQPPRFVINPLWQVVAGDESEEVKTESQREVRNLEAIYPRLSAIPPCPAEPQEINENNDLCEPPLIPLIPIEELEDLQEQVAASQGLDVADRNLQGNTISNDNGNFSDTTEASSVSNSSCSNIRIDQSLNIGSSQPDTAIKPDIAAAAAATAFHAIMKSNEQGSMIDRDLLIKILANPTILESFLGQHIKSTDNNTTSNIPMEINSNVILRSQNHDTKSVSKTAEPETKFPFTCQPHTSCGNPTGHNNNGAIQNYSSLLQAAEPKAAVAFATSEAYDFNNARTNIMMMMPGTSIPISTAHGLPNSQMTSRSGILPTPSPAPTSATVSQAAPPKMNPQPIYPTDEQHYLKLKNLIQEHGYKNDHVQNGLQHLRNECYANGLQPQQHSSSFERGVAPVQSVGLGTTCTTHPAVVMGETTGGGRIIINKQQKRCIYFNTARGCRRGATCLYLHEAAAAAGGEWPRGGVDESDMQMQMPPTKRPKLEIEASSVH